MSMLITFDLDNTLWDVEPTIVRAEHAIFHWFDDRFPGFNEQFNKDVLMSIKAELLTKNSDFQFNISQLRVETYRIAFERFGLPKSEAAQMAQSAFDFFYDWRQKVDLYPGTKKVLWQLANHYRLAVITNGNADIYHPDIDLGASFEFSIRADQVGVAKPNADIFLQAAAKANVEMTKVIHIGDHPSDDVKGINTAGGRSIWFNRHGARRWSSEWEGQPDCEIYSLEELPDTILRLIK